MRTNHHHVGVKISQMNASSRYSQVCFFGTLAILAACGSDSVSTPAATTPTTIAADTITDTTAPTVRFSESGSTAASTDQVVYDVIFSESLASAPTASNFSVNNGTVTGVSAVQSGNTYKITISLDSDLDDVPIEPTVTGSLADSAGNTLDTASTPTYDAVFTADNKSPTATVIKFGETSDTGANVYVVTFSEDVTGVSTSSLTSSQGTISGITETSANSYTVTITANNDVEGDLSLTLSDGIKDDAENAAENTPTLQSAHSVDTAQPTVRFSESGSTAAKAGQVVYDAIFSESLASAPTITKYSVNNGSVAGVSAVQSGNTNKITISLDSGLDDVEIKPTVTGSLVDSAGNTLDTATAPTYGALFTADNKAPTATVNKLGDTDNTGANEYQVMFSEDVTGVDTSSLTSGQGGISAITEASANLYTVTITANDGVDGDLSLTLSDAIKDDANNAAVSAPTLQSAHSVDTTDPALPAVGEATFSALASNGDTVTLSISATFDEYVNVAFDFPNGTFIAYIDSNLIPAFTDGISYFDNNDAITINNIPYAKSWTFFFEIWDSSFPGANWDQPNASLNVAIDFAATDFFGNSTSGFLVDTTFYSEWNVSG